MPPGWFPGHPQTPDPQFRPRIVCATFVPSVFSMVDPLVIEVTRTTGASYQLNDGTSRSMNCRPLPQSPSRFNSMVDEIIQLSGMEKGRWAMNLVSRIVKFLTPDMTGLDCTAIRSTLIVCSAICLGLACPAPSFAQRKALATCEKEWRDNKVFNQAAGITERDWVAKCRADSTNKRADAAALLSVPLKKSQINIVCGGMEQCQKDCGLNARYTCSFGCGPQGCSGQCLNCTSRRVSARTVQTVVANSRRPWQ